jgi:hypothetical protein
MASYAAVAAAALAARAAGDMQSMKDQMARAACDE